MDDLIEKILGEDFEILRRVDFNDLIFIFFQERGYSNPYNDERLNLISGRGPLKINKKTKEYEFTNVYEFYSEYGDNELICPKENKTVVDWDKVLSNIKNRKHINVDDFILLLEHNNLSIDTFDIYSKKPPEIYDIEVKSDDDASFLVEFLKLVNANYLKKSNNHFVINLNLDF
ncbi:MULTISPECIES: hypothetical protein [unclassified Flavobacterium]|uniref:hypothetical protein n=1 Tax=unclassified Flavobacterium TaxID=196869 RepID=UPI002B2268EA|nr:hypothetical protein [Flavobacterium sp. PL02]MEA9414467.1 hypothetical protein [Flavobacterium sp. PL02]